MLLTIEVNAILKKKCCKKNMLSFFYFANRKIVFALLKKVIVGHVVIIPINLKKKYLEKTLTEAL